MNREDIIKYVKDLSWNYSIETQTNAIEMLSKIDEANFDLVFNKNLKPTWENAVKVVAQIGFPENVSMLPNLAWLLQDVNWPGAAQAMEILSSIERPILMPIIENALLIANESDDTMWIAGINLLVKKAGCSRCDFSDEKIFELLRKADF